MSNSTPGLTEQELDIASAARFDLGSGYPQMEAPEYIRRLFREDRLEELGLMTSPHWNSDKQSRMEHELSVAVQETLGCNSHDSRIYATFSGSIAIDRAIAACLERSRSQGADKMEVITTSPSIDIMSDLLGERSEVQVLYAETDQRSTIYELPLESLLNLIRSPLPARTTRAVLLTSPENPTGAVWSQEQLALIASLCSLNDFPLIVDHCFHLSGVQGSNLPAIWHLSDLNDTWIGIWDTGKTFGLNGEKLGFMVTSKSLSPYLEGALRVLQYSVSRRQQLFFTELLRQSPYYDYTSILRDTCRSNLENLRRTVSPFGIECVVPVAGSLALVNVSRTGMHDSEFQRLLLQGGIGVVTGTPFFHGKTKNRSLVRFALARDLKLFGDAMDRLQSILHAMPPSLPHQEL